MAADPLLPAEALANRFIQLSLAGSWGGPAQSPAVAQIQAEARTQAEALAPRLDWSVVLRQAAAERLAPLLYHTLRQSSLLPADVLAGWRQAYLSTAQWNVYLLHQLDEVVQRLKARNVPILALKGVALMATVYNQNLALRPLRDIDLLIRPAHLQVTLAVLDDLGYRPTGVEPQSGTAAAFESQLRLLKSGSLETVLEIHWSLFDSPYYQNRLSLDWVWENARAVELQGVALTIPGNEAHLLYLCAHLWLHHQGAGVLWLHDIAQVMAAGRDDIDWSQVLAQAQSLELVLPLKRVLPVVAAQYGVAPAAGVLRQLDRLQPSPTEAQAFAGLAAEHLPVASRFWTDLRGMPNWADRARFAWSNLMPSPAYMRFRYRIANSWLLPFYYPYRWLLGIRSALWKV